MIVSVAVNATSGAAFTATLNGPLQCRQDVARAVSSDGPRTGTDRDAPVSATEGILQYFTGTPRLSESVHATAIRAARGALRGLE